TPVAAAEVSAKDAAATRAYLQAEYTRARGEAQVAQSSVLAMAAFDTRLADECPGVLANAPRRIAEANQSAGATTKEIIDAVGGAGEQPEHPVEVSFALTTRQLRWSNEKLTRLVHAVAEKRAAESAVAPPDLCSDMRY